MFSFHLLVGFIVSELLMFICAASAPETREDSRDKVCRCSVCACVRQFVLVLGSVCVSAYVY